MIVNIMFLDNILEVKSSQVKSSQVVKLVKNIFIHFIIIKNLNFIFYYVYRIHNV